MTTKFRFFLIADLMELAHSIFSLECVLAMNSSDTWRSNSTDFGTKVSNLLQGAGSPFRIDVSLTCGKVRRRVIGTLTWAVNCILWMSRSAKVVLNECEVSDVGLSFKDVFQLCCREEVPPESLVLARMRLFDARQILESKMPFRLRVSRTQEKAELATYADL